jgi:hypothetical protein
MLEADGQLGDLPIEERDQALRQMRADGLSLTDIGLRAGLSKQRVSHIVKGVAGRVGQRSSPRTEAIEAGIALLRGEEEVLKRSANYVGRYSGMKGLDEAGDRAENARELSAKCRLYGEAASFLELVLQKRKASGGLRRRNEAIENELRELAKAGAPRPSGDTRIGIYLRDYTSARSGAHRPGLRDELIALHPRPEEWFKDVRSLKRMNQLRELARAGAPRPPKGTPLGNGLVGYTRRSCRMFRPGFREELIALHPRPEEWFNRPKD